MVAVQAGSGPGAPAASPTVIVPPLATAHASLAAPRSPPEPAKPKTLEEWKAEVKQYIVRPHVKERKLTKKVHRVKPPDTVATDMLERWEIQRVEREERDARERERKEREVLKERLLREQQQRQAENERLEREAAEADARLQRAEDRQAALAAYKIALAEYERLATDFARRKKELEEEEERLFAKLRKAFDDFDTDGSGSISTSELQNVLAAAEIPMPTEQLSEMVAAADRDGDGEISFDEFITRLEKELEAGGGGLMSVMRQASSHFKWLNPLEWFSRKPTDLGSPPVPPTPPPPEVEEVVAPPPAPSEPEASKPSQSAAVVITAPETKPGKRVRTQKAILSEFIVREKNRMMAEEQRTAEQRMTEFRDSQHGQYMDYTKHKMQLFREAEIERVKAAEALAQQKREVGVQMRIQLKAAYEAEQAKTQKRMKIIAAKTLHVRQVKKEETAKRHEEARVHGHMIALQAAEERQERKEQSLATVRAQQKAARDFAAQVKYETRPDVRKETREFFQAQRKAVCAHERAMQAEGRALRDEENDSFMEKAIDTVLLAKELSGPRAMHAKREIWEQKRQAAEEVRQQLQSEHERRTRREEGQRENIEARYSATMAAKFDRKVHRTAEVRDELRESIKGPPKPWGHHKLYEC